MSGRWRRILLGATAVLALVVVVGAVAIHRKTAGKLDHGTVFSQTSGDLVVKSGELFSIEVFGYRGAGDNWTMAVPDPDPAVARAAGDEYVGNAGLKDLLGFGGTGNLGTGGHYYFTFRAQNPGRTTITVHVPYRDELGGSFPGGPNQAKRQFTVDVR